MKFQAFINESYNNKELSMDEAIDYIKKNCKKSLDMYNNSRPLYRSVNVDMKAWTTDVPKNRKSAFVGSNYYNLFLSESDTWKMFPRRDQSFIGATSSERVYGHTGNPYICFPVDGTKIGVCPSNDLWDSFGMDLQHFSYQLKDLLGDVGYHKQPKSLDELRKAFDLLDEYIEAGNVSGAETKEFLVNIGYLSKNGRIFKKTTSNKKGMMMTLEEFFDPKRNGFSVWTIGNKMPLNKEAWWSAPTIFISDHDDIIREFEMKL